MNRTDDPAAHDHESDPAHTPGAGWGEEGGASHLGPATQLSAGHPPDQEGAATDEAREA